MSGTASPIPFVLEADKRSNQLTRGSIGPILFCLTIHPFVSLLSSELCVWYLDDGTLGDSSRVISKDLDLVVHEGAARGLSLNQRKTEVVYFRSDAPPLFCLPFLWLN